MNLLSRMRIRLHLGLACAISIAFSLLLADCTRTVQVSVNHEVALMVDVRLVKVGQLESISGQRRPHLVLSPGGR